MNDVLAFFNTNTTAFMLCVAFFSLFIGSFLNVVIYRLPLMLEQGWAEECRMYLGLKPQKQEKLNLTLPLSHCPECKKAIMPWHNIPILSYLFLRGKCAHCKRKISIRYPIVEGVTAIMSLYIAFRFGLSWQTLSALVFSWIIIALTFIDIDYHLLPDELTYGLLWCGLFSSLFSLFCNTHDAILGAIGGYLVFAITQWLFQLTTGKIGMGQGDYKFLAALGAYLGWQQLPLIILLASLLGILFAVTHMVVKKEYKSVPLPFGPYLAMAGWFALLWGDEIMRYYMLIMFYVD